MARNGEVSILAVFVNCKMLLLFLSSFRRSCNICHVVDGEIRIKRITRWFSSRAFTMVLIEFKAVVKSYQDCTLSWEKSSVQVGELLDDDRGEQMLEGLGSKKE